MKPDYADDLVLATDALSHSLANDDLRPFYATLRKTRLPFLFAELADDPGRLFTACAAIVSRLGSLSPAVALAVENHIYVTSAIAAFPAEGDAAVNRRRNALLAAVLENRRFVANTNSRVSGPTVGAVGVRARRSGTSVLVNGSSDYSSLATQADMLMLLTEIEGEGLSLLAIEPLHGNAAVEIGPLAFPRAMADSDTRKMIFHDLLLPDSAVVVTSGSTLAPWLVPYEMAWHQLLLCALFLGAAAGAIDEACAYMRATTGRDGRSLAETDGMIVDVGRLALEHRSAWMALEKAGEALAEVRELPRDADKVERAARMANVAKYGGTRAAEAIVTGARRMVGARSFADQSALERLSHEALFATLAPEATASIERRFGRLALSETALPEMSA